MKKLFLFLAVASTSMFVSCSDDDSKGDGGGSTAATSIVLAANVTAVEVGQPVVFTVTDNNAKVVTSTSTILVNNVEITGSTFTPTEAGSFAIKATHKNSKDVVLESNTVTVTVTEPAVADDSFVVNGVNYETPTALYQYLGIFELSTDNYVIGYAFNPFEEVEEAGSFTYPTDLYIYSIYPISPSGTDPETGDPTFTIEGPTTGNFNFANPPVASSVFDFQYAINNEAVLPTVAADRLAMITNVNLNVTSLDLVSDVTNLEATYSISLTDGTMIEGEYSGETGIYGLPQGKATKAKKVANAAPKLKMILDNYKKNNLKK